MRLYQDRLSNDFELELADAFDNLSSRFLYAGNVLTFLSDKFAYRFREFLAKDGHLTRILLMHPYSLFGRDRMSVESQKLPHGISDARAGFSASELQCGATYSTRQAHWIPDRLSTTIKSLVAVFRVDPEMIRLTSLNPLCSVLVCDERAFVTLYHYGRHIENAECTAQKSPVIAVDSTEPFFDLLINHINYLWNQPTAYRLAQCVESLREPAGLVIRQAKDMQFNLPILGKDDDWLDLGLLLEEVTKVYCPSESLRGRRGVFFSHAGERLPEIRELKRLVTEEYFSEGYALLDEDHTGESVFASLEDRIRRCSHAIVLASPDVKTGGHYPNANVLHELGWCQALLGTRHVLVLRSPEASLPSNIGGIIYQNYEGRVDDLNFVRGWLTKRGFVRRKLS